MNRSDFLKRMALLGVGTTIAPRLLWSCDPKYDFYPGINVNFSGKVLIIGAGSAGLTAGHALKQHNIDFQILEASDRYGGRVMKADNFVDFPVDLGAEWIHTHPSILAKILNDPAEQAGIDIINYNPETFYLCTKENSRNETSLQIFMVNGSLRIQHGLTSLMSLSYLI